MQSGHHGPRGPMGVSEAADDVRKGREGIPERRMTPTGGKISVHIARRGSLGKGVPPKKGPTKVLNFSDKVSD